MTLRRAILIGFGLVIALWAASAYDLVHRLDALQERATAVSDRFNRADRLLTRIRFQVLLSSLAFRDALLETETLDRHRREIAATRRAVDQAMLEYLPVVDSQEESRIFANLGVELEAFWQSMLPVLEWDPAKRAAEALSILTQSVVPKRELVLNISDAVRRLNREAYGREQAEIAEIYGETRVRVWVTAGVLLFLSIAVAVVVLAHTIRLERHLRRQMERDAENRHALQRLSERLVHAQEEERRAIARELHDEIGQALTAIKMELTVAERGVPAGTRLQESRLAEARAISDRALHAVRDLSKLLHPSLLDDMGLAATLEWYLRAFSRRTGLRAELQRDGSDERVAPRVETYAYRIVQEALTNIARHAHATSCRVYLQRLRQTIVITVEDDGVGFDPAARENGARQQGVGLLGIQERVQNLSGSFRLDSAPGKGTRLIVELPVALPQQGETATEPLDLMATAFGSATTQDLET